MILAGATRALIEYIRQKPSNYQQAETTVLSVRKLSALLLVLTLLKWWLVKESFCIGDFMHEPQLSGH